MIKSEQASLSVTRIAVITIITIFALSVGVLAASVDVRNVRIILSDNCEIEVFTTKTKVSDILEENHIVILPEESVFPNLDSEINDNSSRIVITGLTQDAAVVASLAEGDGINLDSLLSAYNTIVEKIIVQEEAIPFETVTKGSAKLDNSETTRVVQKGREGTKKVTYKVKYQNDIEIERTVIKEEITKKPRNQIVQVTNVTTRNSTASPREENSEPVINTSSGKGATLASKVEGITPTKKVLNASAYTASTCGKSPSSPSYGITANGAKATAWYTVAAGKGYAFGTIIYIPYFANEPNGGWFVVQDRGGAISNNKLDVYMNTYNECIKFGRRNLECYIYEF